MPNKISRFWQELKRRNVFRVITVYAGAAFVILELVDMVREPFELPNWSFKLVIVILSIGFIIAVILSWVYDIHPEGGVVKTEPVDQGKAEDKSKSSNSWKIASYISFVVIVFLIVLNVIPHSGKSEKLEKSIAVLPFQDFSTDPNQESMCMGLTDEIINHLFKIESFDKVVSLNSVLTYRGTDKRTPKIAEELGVNYILEGTYKKIGEKVRVSAQLIDGKNDKHLWQHEYDRLYMEIQSIQSDIALQIAGQLKAFMTEPEKQRIRKVYSSNSEAYQKYQLGRLYFRKGRSREDLETAIQLFQESVALDPDFPLVYTSLADAYLSMYWYYYDRSTYALTASREAIEKAFKIDPELPEAYIEMARYYYVGFLDYDKALEQMEKASAYVPEHPQSHFITASIYRRMGRWEEAIDEFLKAYQSDPRYPDMIHNLSETYAFLGKYQESLDLIREVMMFAPENPINYEMKILATLLRDGNTQLAREAIQEAEIYHCSEYEITKDALYITPVTLDICEGSYQKALVYLSESSWEGSLNVMYYHPKSLYQAWLSEQLGLPDRARLYYDTSRIILEEKLNELPDDPRIMGALGIAYAGMGNREKALRFSKDAVTLYSLEKDAYFGLTRIEDLAWTYVLLGENDSALDQIEILLSNTGAYSAPLLKLDPRWKPLWDHPEFVRLTDLYAHK